MRIYHGVVYYNGVEYTTITEAIEANRSYWEQVRQLRAVKS